jgi:hypothetical protein
MPVLLKGKCEKKRRRPEASGTNCKFKGAGKMPALQEEKTDGRKGEDRGLDVTFTTEAERN